MDSLNPCAPPAGLPTRRKFRLPLWAKRFSAVSLVCAAVFVASDCMVIAKVRHAPRYHEMTWAEIAIQLMKDITVGPGDPEVLMVSLLAELGVTRRPWTCGNRGLVTAWRQYRLVRGSAHSAIANLRGTVPGLLLDTPDDMPQGEWSCAATVQPALFSCGHSRSPSLYSSKSPVTAKRPVPPPPPEPPVYFQLTFLGTLDGETSAATDINNQGVVVGWYTKQELFWAFCYAPGLGVQDLTQLATFPAGYDNWRLSTATVSTS